MNKNLLKVLSLLFFAAALAACGDKDKHEPEYFPPRADNRVYFIYMAADNNLYTDGYATQNINDILSSATKKNVGNGRVLIFYDTPTSPTQLLEIKAGANGKGQKTVLWEEPQGRNLNTALPSVFADALDLMQYHATEGGQVVDSYILDMWSHGDAWEQHSRLGIAQRSVANEGNYYGDYLELEDFVDCLEPDVFDAVVFAQCYSASIEMLYLLRDKTDMVIGSAPIMPGYGMPYHKVLPSIFAPVFDYKGMVDAYCGFYDNMSLDAYYGQGRYWRNSGTMAAFDCSAFTADFVATMRNIYASAEYQTALTTFSNASMLSDGESIGVQSYCYSSPFKYFDVGDFVNNITGLSPVLYSEFWEHMNQIVAYKRTGGRLFIDENTSNSIDQNKFTGMSTYVMINTSVYNTSLNDMYKRTSWYNAVYQ